MPLMIGLLLAAAVQSGPVSNGRDFGSCRAPAGGYTDLRRVTFLANRELVLESGVGPVRIVLDRQKFRLQLMEAADGEMLVVNVGDLVGEGDARADVFLTLGLLDGRPLLYWRETYQHRSFRQGLLAIAPEAIRGDWDRLLAPICEGRGGVDITH